ncbi:MAG: hypothetical protein HQL72_09070 [Magnetococcales bacterium]|nr:hypothetical protein [Magnetococcales bacterium]
MTDRMLTFEDGQVQLGDRLIPGILVRQSVRGSVRFDEAEQDGLSGTVKIPMGWEDADIALTVDLLTDKTTCYEKLAILTTLFKGADSKGNPLVLSVANVHCLARGIRQVVFSGLDSEESDRDDVIQTTLRFVEHVPAVTRVEERAIAGGDSSTAPVTGNTEPELDPALLVDLEG